MTISVFDLFTVGIGPSSSHTVGPMRAAQKFATELSEHQVKMARVSVELYGSLALTGKGHGTDLAVVLGLEGELPESIDADVAPIRFANIVKAEQIQILGRFAVPFLYDRDLEWKRRERLPLHSNGMVFNAYDSANQLFSRRTFYSIGGGFVVDDEARPSDHIVAPTPAPFPITSADELLELSASSGLSLSQMMLENEKMWHGEEEIRSGLLNIWQAMKGSVNKGCSRTEARLPGKLNVRRRAPGIYEHLMSRRDETAKDPLEIMDWVNLFALAVNEENASGGRVVTAPTNGAAGIIPAVIHYYESFCPSASEDGIVNFLLSAAAIGILYKENASISGAEVGCQGEVGVACSMAAAGLTEALGGTIQQVEEAAEIGMEHNLGLTCDPVGGLVQVPCIERNAMGAIKAINASRLALRGDGKHLVSLDRVIKTMRQTGADMKTKYKESSRGGLAVNVVEC